MVRSARTGLVALLSLLAFMLGGAASASASVLWSAGAEQPLLEEWANFSCQDAGRIARVESPASAGRYAYRVNLNDGDDSYGERCEMAMGSPTRAGFPVFRQGEESWVAYQVLIPANWPGEGWKYNEITQFKQVNDLCAPALSLHVEQGQLLLFQSADNRGSCGGDSIWSAPMSYGRWIELLYHVKWSSDPSVGFVELFGDLDGSGLQLLMPRRSTFTMKMDSAGRTEPVGARLGIYRDRSISGDATAYFDGFTIATDRASAEGGAFGPAGLVEPPAPPVVPVDPPALPVPTIPAPTPPANPSPPANPPVAGASAPRRVCRVPRLVRHRYRYARRLLKRAGCRTRRPRHRHSTRRNRGRVVAQSFRPGRVVPSGTVVRLVVGRR